VRAIQFSALLFALIAFVGLIASLSTIFDHVSLNYNEGWNALQATHAMERGNLYARPDLASFTNYPPVSFFLLGWLGKLTGDLIFTGRVVALLSLLLVSLSVGLVASRLGAAASAAVLAATSSRSSTWQWTIRRCLRTRSGPQASFTCLADRADLARLEVWALAS